MKTMKLFVMVFMLLTFIPAVQAQDQDYNWYLQRVLQRIDEGDCEGAQKNYNVYKELSGKTIASVEEMIKDCAGEYRIGNTISVNGENYIIAYLMENKQHGFAIKDVGVQNLVNQQEREYIRDKRIPTLEEMKIIYQNNANIGLTGTYWTRSTKLYRYGFGGIDNYYYYYYIDFLSGKQGESSPDSRNGILLIHRF